MRVGSMFAGIGGICTGFYQAGAELVNISLCGRTKKIIALAIHKNFHKKVLPAFFI